VCIDDYTVCNESLICATSLLSCAVSLLVCAMTLVVVQCVEPFAHTLFAHSSVYQLIQCVSMILLCAMNLLFANIIHTQFLSRKARTWWNIFTHLCDESHQLCS